MAASTSIQPAFSSPQPRVAPAANDLTPRLERIRRWLDVDFITLHLLENDQLVLNCSAGVPFPALENETHFVSPDLTAPLIVSDTALDPRFDTLNTIRFYAGIPLVIAAGDIVGLLNLFDCQPRSVELARRLSALITEIMELPAAPTSQSRTIACLQGKLDDQTRLIGEQADALAHSKLMFERAAATAHIGVWECDLATEELTWTDGVYDLFEFPRGAPIDRPTTLCCYSEASRAELTKLRNQAIAQGIGFTLDAEIITAKGNKRWMRLTANVETENGVSVRAFGMKQDITEEKILADRTRYLAEFDVMTDLANRGRFQSRLAQSTPAIGALLLIDLDGFKAINDNFGHAAGDECLKETALRLKTVGIGADLVARIGGDEFAVLVGPQYDLPMLECLGAQIVDCLGHPVMHGTQLLDLGASVGIALATPDMTPDQLFKQADSALYTAKADGRNRYWVFNSAKI